MKERQYSFDVIRTFCTFMVVFIHCGYVYVEYNIAGPHPMLMTYASGNWGGSFVSMFFMLSGAALYYNWRDRLKKIRGKGGLLDFYWKRWLTIFPMFYVAWFIMYVINSRKLGTWYWAGSRRIMWMTALGMDGYFMHHGLNYYCLGEWFLGAIIILYLLYPLMQFLFLHARWPVTLLLTVIFVFNVYRHLLSSMENTNLFIYLVKYYNSHITMPDSRCVWTCLYGLWLGMLYIQYKNVLGRFVAALASLLLIILLAVVHVPLPEVIASDVMGFLWFILLSWVTDFCVGQYRKGRFHDIFSGLLARWIRFMSKYSYGIFLTHHVILYALMEPFRGGEVKNLAQSLLLILCEFVLASLASFLLTEGVNGALKGIGKLTGKRREAA
ncbi:MAG: acyltransferase [Lachnospiraceae bacterium]|nr:acyltransferase [Lachnospiraceae bacterium]